MPVYMLNSLYEKYSDKEVLFNSNIKKYTSIVTNNILLKIGNGLQKCILYACSMKNAKIIAQMDKPSFSDLLKSNNKVSLRLSFKPPEEKEVLTFYVNSTVKGYKNYSPDNKDTYLFNLEFNQKPSDFLIEVLGNIADYKEKVDKRKNSRIEISGKIPMMLGLKSNKVTAVIEKIKRPCILRNLSLSGAEILLYGLPKYLIEKDVEVLISMDNNFFSIEGKIKRANSVGGKNGVSEFGIEFNETMVPIEYLKILNGYLDNIKENNN